jgi:membrane-associated phospholipid phosphatase
VPTAKNSPNTRKQLFSLHSTDRLMIAFWSLLSLLSLTLHARIPVWPWIVAGNVAACCLICALAFAARASGLKAVRWAHDWAAFPLVVFTYKEVYFLVRFIHGGRDYDRLLIAVDHALFGVHPTEWLARFANPYLTEVLQIAYSLFYVLFIAAGVELYRRSDLSAFRYCRLTVVYSFFVSYVGYFSLPAVGPRFTLHDFASIDTDLPGLFFTPFLRWFVNTFESIHAGATSSEALAAAQRDVFPSGHTLLTLITIILAYKLALKIRHWLLGTGSLLIAATVYLRYHYVIDIVVGALLAIPCLLSSAKIYALCKGDSDADHLPQSAAGSKKNPRL